MNRGKQHSLICCREADETACICSEVEELSLKSKRIWDVVSQVFQTIFQLDLVNSYGALHHFVLMSEILKKNKPKKKPKQKTEEREETNTPFPYCHSAELKTRNENTTVAADMDCLFNSSNLFTLMKHQKIWVSGN